MPLARRAPGTSMAKNILRRAEKILRGFLCYRWRVRPVLFYIAFSGPAFRAPGIKRFFPGKTIKSEKPKLDNLADEGKNKIIGDNGRERIFR
jgi:hypothetical protein